MLEKKNKLEINVNFSFKDNGFLNKISNLIKNNTKSNDELFKEYKTKLDFYNILLLREFDDLLCLNATKNIDKYWYQIETVKKVLKYFRGRVLLSDEVGLGKTIEAGMLIKEYIMRGLVKKVLILTPSSLINQWKSELINKFSLEFITTNDVDIKKEDNFWEENDFIISSINIAKSKSNFDNVIMSEYDLVVVDEAHHLRNKKTLSWQLVNSLQKKFIFLLTATPVQNNLLELYNLLTLLKPGILSTEAEFKKEYVDPKNSKIPKNSDKLRNLLREVMIRNTRSLVDVKLPKRFANTINILPSDLESDVYFKISELVKKYYSQEKGINRILLNNLLNKAGSCLFSLQESLIDMKKRFIFPEIDEIIKLVKNIKDTEKGKKLIELVKKSDSKKIIFTNYLKTFSYLAEKLKKNNIPFVEFRSGMTNSEKDKSITNFKNEINVLLSTESGGEGHNIQFCNTIINYDLPWNPMKIEQRIGRIHRIGQEKDVFIFNFCIKGSIEEKILYILDKKINMFELVIGEIDSIIGNMDTDEDFEDIIFGLWLQSTNEKELDDKIESFAENLVNAKSEYQKTKELDDTLFKQEFEV